MNSNQIAVADFMTADSPKKAEAKSKKATAMKIPAFLNCAITAKANTVLGFTFGGDYSIQTAAKNGGITKVSTVDVKYKNVLGLFISRTTIVTGE